MCQKQCRDQNGFKCHLTSESHQRQLLLVAENTGSFLRQFSKEFEANFMQVIFQTNCFQFFCAVSDFYFFQILRTCHGTKRVRANEIYQEYIKDKVLHRSCNLYIIIHLIFFLFRPSSPFCLRSAFNLSTACNLLCFQEILMLWLKQFGDLIFFCKIIIVSRVMFT